jgi:hypothetical protein
MNARFDPTLKALFEEVLGMEESATYQAIIRRGRVRAACLPVHATLLRAILFR